VILAFWLIVFFAPLMVVIALAVKLDGGPVLYGHRRIGPDNKPFRCWKFRSMVVGAENVLQQLIAQNPQIREEWERNCKLRADPRVTPVGKLLRAFSVDELPQLFNVIWGTMSLVGPRPIVEAEIRRYDSTFATYCSCRPGITGLWQVEGRSDLDYSRRIELDQHYAEHWSLWLDFMILVKTVVIVTRRLGAY
jgi:lipopolysaccharide/colanic/teichoic acid biosynthesis glycosyltransferase